MTLALSDAWPSATRFSAGITCTSTKSKGEDSAVPRPTHLHISSTINWRAASTPPRHHTPHTHLPVGGVHDERGGLLALGSAPHQGLHAAQVGRALHPAHARHLTTARRRQQEELSRGGGAWPTLPSGKRQAHLFARRGVDHDALPGRGAWRAVLQQLRVGGQRPACTVCTRQQRSRVSPADDARTCWPGGWRAPHRRSSPARLCELRVLEHRGADSALQRGEQRGLRGARASAREAERRLVPTHGPALRARSAQWQAPPRYLVARLDPEVLGRRLRGDGQRPAVRPAAHLWGRRIRQAAGNLPSVSDCARAVHLLACGCGSGCANPSCRRSQLPKPLSGSPHATQLGRAQGHRCSRHRRMSSHCGSPLRLAGAPLRSPERFRFWWAASGAAGWSNFTI